MYLPTEILQSIFELIEDRTTLYQCTFVCKAWRTPAEHKFFSYVCVDSILDLSRLTALTTSNPLLPYSVKKIDLNINAADDKSEYDTQVYNLLSQLPKLQHLYFDPSSCYSQLLQALIDLKLPYLKTISEPLIVDDWKDYTFCVLHARRSLEELLLTDSSALRDSIGSDMVYYNRLHQRLCEFKKLAKIRIVQKAKNPIKEIDLIVDMCSQSLQVIDFTMSKNNTVQEDMDEKSILRCTPRTNILDLIATFSNNLKGHKLLPYIKHKFPRLKSLTLTLNLSSLSNLELNRLFTEFSWIESVSINGTHYTVDEICDSIRLLTGSAGPGLLEHINIDYANDLLFHPTLRLVREWNSVNVYTISYSARRHDLGHMPVMDEFGDKIKTLDLTFPNKMIENDMTLGEMMDHIFECCTSLSELTLRSYNFKREWDDNCLNKIQIKKLNIRDCDIYQRGFECLFCNISSIDELNFSKVVFRNYSKKISTFIYLGLPNTQIKLLSVDLNDIDYINGKKRPRYIFLNIYVELSDRLKTKYGVVDFYYKYDFAKMDDKRFKPICAKDYYDDNYDDHLHFGIGCKFLNQVKIKYNDTAVLLPENPIIYAVRGH